MDTTALTVAIKQASPPQTDPASTLPIDFDVAFSKAINPTTFGIGDITQNGTATGITWSITNSGDDTNFTLSATAVTCEGYVAKTKTYNYRRMVRAVLVSVIPEK